MSGTSNWADFISKKDEPSAGKWESKKSESYSKDKKKADDPKAKLSKAFLRTARYATPFCDKWDKWIQIKDVLATISEKFHDKRWSEEMAVEVVKEMEDEYEYWLGEREGTHMCKVKPGWWEGIDYTSKSHDPILRACVIAMSETFRGDEDAIDLGSLMRLVDADKWRWTMEMMEEHLSKFTDVVEVFYTPDVEGPIVKWFNPKPANSEEPNTAPPQAALEDTEPVDVVM